MEALARGIFVMSFNKDRIVFKVPFVARLRGRVSGREISTCEFEINATLNTNTMKNTLRKLPFILAFAVTIFAASCSDDMAIEPMHTDTDKEPPLPPPPSGSNAVSSDTTTVIIG